MAQSRKSIDPETYLAEKFIALRAYQYWVRRGCPFDSPDIDWYKAVEDIRHEMTKASGMTESECAVHERRLTASRK